MTNCTLMKFFLLPRLLSDFSNECILAMDIGNHTGHSYKLRSKQSLVHLNFIAIEQLKIQVNYVILILQ